MFVKNLSKTDLTYRGNNKVILLKAGKVTRIDDTYATPQDIKNAFLNHVDIINSYEDLGIANFIKEIDGNKEEAIEEIIEDIKEESKEESKEDIKEESKEKKVDTKKQTTTKKQKSKNKNKKVVKNISEKK